MKAAKINPSSKNMLQRIAESAIAVAAYDFNWKPAPPYQPQLENLNSPEPVTIYFDANGNRLSVPELDTKTVKLALEHSAQPRTSTPEMAQGIGANQSGFAAVTAVGQSYFGSDYLTLDYFGVPVQKPTDVTRVIASLGHCFTVVTVQLPIYAATANCPILLLPRASLHHA